MISISLATLAMQCAGDAKGNIKASAEERGSYALSKILFVIFGASQLLSCAGDV